MVTQLVVQVFQRVGILLSVGGSDCIFPVAGTGGNDKCTGRNQVRLEATVLSLDADTHIAPTRERRHFVVGITHTGKRCIRDRCYNLLLDLVTVLVGLGNSVGLVGVRLGNDPTARLDGTDRDHVLGRAGRGDGVRAGVKSVVGAGTGVAGREYIDHLLVTGLLRQRIARGGIVAGGRPSIVVFLFILPTVV